MAEKHQLRGFVGSAFGNQNKNVDTQDLQNWYLEVSESPNAKVPTGLLPCPGFETFCTLPTSPVRGLFAQNDLTFGVGGEILYELTRLGDIATRPMTTLATPVAPTITNSPLTPALGLVSTPVVTHGGTLGSTSYGYKITALNALGETAGSVEGRSDYGNAVLSATNYNLVTWERLDGATNYKVYRTTGGAAVALIAVTHANTLSLPDIGTTGTPISPPSTDTTGGVAGTSVYGYKIVASLGLGRTAASAEAQTLTGQLTLDTTNFNILTWPAVPRAHTYRVYRVTNAGAAVTTLIGTTADLTFNDVGDVGENETPSAADTTGAFALTDDGTPVQIWSSGDAGQQVLIISGGSAFVYDLATNTLAKVVDGATSGGYIGGYFVILDAATSTLKCSELLDGYEWDDGQVYQRTSAGDRWLAMGVTSNEIWLMGSNSADVWSLTGDDETRFAPFNNVSIDQGIIASGSLNLVTGSSFSWLGQSDKGAGIVWRSEGYSARQISTRGIEREMESYAALADAVAWSYQQEGHHFYVLNFPSDDSTWCYDGLTGEWHRRGFWDPANMAFTSYRPQCHAFAFGGVGFGLHLVGDRLSGVVASMSPNKAFDIEGSTIRRLRESPHTSSRQKQLTIYALYVDLEVGLGVPSGQGSDPTVMLQISKDNGRTWGRELWRSAGAQGLSHTRVKFDRLGDARDWIFRLVVSDPIMWRVAGAFIEADEGTS